MMNDYPTYYRKLSGLSWIFLTLCAALILPGYSETNRNLTDKDGRSIQAVLTGKSDYSVTFRRVSDRKEFNVALDTLSQADQEFIRNWDPKAGQPTIDRTRKVFYVQYSRPRIPTQYTTTWRKVCRPAGSVTTVVPGGCPPPGGKCGK